MSMTCKVCGHTAPALEKDGKQVCAACGCEFEAAAAEPKAADQNKGATVNHLECPICKNKSNNVVKDGVAHCSLCGTEFDPKASAGVGTSSYAASGKTGAKSSAKREALEKDKNKNIIIGVVFVICFWPVSIYFFYKAYQISKELEKL